MNPVIEKVTEFVGNKKEPADAPIKSSALSLTKVGVGAAFITAVLGGLVGIIDALGEANEAVIDGAFHVVAVAIAVGGALAAIDIVVRGAVSVWKPREGGRSPREGGP